MPNMPDLRMILNIPVVEVDSLIQEIRITPRERNPDPQVKPLESQPRCCHAASDTTTRTDGPHGPVVDGNRSVP